MSNMIMIAHYQNPSDLQNFPTRTITMNLQYIFYVIKIIVLFMYFIITAIYQGSWDEKVTISVLLGQIIFRNKIIKKQAVAI